MNHYIHFLFHLFLSRYYSGDRMKCTNCKKAFYIKKSFLTLFETKKYYLCQQCYQETPIRLKAESFYLDEMDVKVISIFARKNFINYDCYTLELSQIFEKFYPSYFVLIIEELYLDEVILEVLEWLQQNVNKKLLIITFYVKI